MHAGSPVNFLCVIVTVILITIIILKLDFSNPFPSCSQQMDKKAILPILYGSNGMLSS